MPITPGNWFVMKPIFDGDVVMSKKEDGSTECVAAQILNRSDAKLISSAPQLKNALIFSEILIIELISNLKKFDSNSECIRNSKEFLNKIEKLLSYSN